MMNWQIRDEKIIGTVKRIAIVAQSKFNQSKREIRLLLE